MPIIKSAIKRMKQMAKRRERNVVTKKNIKSANKAFKANPDQKSLSKVQSELDKAVKKGILNKNTAARRKSKNVLLVKSAAEAPAKKPKASKTSSTKKPAKSAAKPAEQPSKSANVEAPKAPAKKPKTPSAPSASDAKSAAKSTEATPKKPAAKS